MTSGTLAKPQSSAGHRLDDTVRRRNPLWQFWKHRFATRKRSIQVPREGKFLIGITLMVGFAAINTGNNLLFIGWGLLLATILISGILSESTLRAVRVTLTTVGECRAQTKSTVMLAVENPGARLPAFGVASGAKVQPPAWARVDDSATRRRLWARVTSTVSPLLAPLIAPARYQLRLSPQSGESLAANFISPFRGIHVVSELFAKTAYPFGFFEKHRHYFLETPRELVVYPARVDTGFMTPEILSRLGQSPTHAAGAGDEYFSMRPFREGDDPRKIAWRVSARTGRAVLKETEVWATRELVLVVKPPAVSGADPASGNAVRWQAEGLIAATASLAEDLLQEDHAVGLVGPGIFVAPQRGPRQREMILAALARANPGDAQEWGPLGPQVVTIGVTLAGIAGPSGVQQMISIPQSVVDDVRPGATP